MDRQWSANSGTVAVQGGFCWNPVQLRRSLTPAMQLGIARSPPWILPAGSMDGMEDHETAWNPVSHFSDSRRVCVFVCVCAGTCIYAVICIITIYHINILIEREGGRKIDQGGKESEWVSSTLSCHCQGEDSRDPFGARCAWGWSLQDWHRATGARANVSAGEIGDSTWLTDLPQISSACIRGVGSNPDWFLVCNWKLPKWSALDSDGFWCLAIGPDSDTDMHGWRMFCTNSSKVTPEFWPHIRP